MANMQETSHVFSRKGAKAAKKKQNAISFKYKHIKNSALFAPLRE